MSQIFDPFGLISPFILRAKLIIQNLWELKLGWDEDLPQNICTLWQEFRNEIKFIENLKIPRYISINSFSIELHAFCDASERAYGFCIYVRLIDCNSASIAVHLMLSKTRVAPLKCLTIPKLELCAAHLMTKGIESLSKRIIANHIFAWSDSQIVLAWIKKSPLSLKQFVANRIQYIQSISHIGSWNYIRSNDNPADICSRGMALNNLLESKKWWNGPEFLSFRDYQVMPTDDFNEITVPELKETIFTLTSTIQEFNLLDKFSSLLKLLCVTSFIKRFIFNCRNSEADRKFGFITTQEIQSALESLIKISQDKFFRGEIKVLKNSKPISNKILLSLSPFVDKNNIMRVGGRLQLSELPFNEKYPIILHHKCHLAVLLARDCHFKHIHAPPSIMLSALRQNYWIIGMNKLVKSIFRKCLTCIEQRAKPKPQLMGNLPADRVRYARPFLHVGVDYGGPFTIRLSKGRGKTTLKAYLALFVCFSTRAVHLEAVSDLTGEAFLACLRRFISRRGLPNTIYSDNGRNFCAASKYLSGMYSLLSEKENNINKFMIENQITWKFSPAYAPHFGGLWEAGIKSAKSYIKIIINDTILTFEELSTLFAQVEGILNSRPLIPMTNDPNDLQVLTPGHFLIGEPLISLPDTESAPEMNLRSRWTVTQQKLNSFWKQWHRNYLQELQKRVKWKRPIEDLKIDDMVLVRNNNFPFKWNLGRVREIFKGSDGHVRVVSIKVSKGIIRRSSNQLIRLPIE